MATNKNNLINRVQKWMDTLQGQTFMNYAYSWGAAVVILGTLFKLLHLSGANLMLCVGMGTEVFVFIVSGFERVTERVSETATAENAPSLTQEEVDELAAAAASASSGQPIVVQGGGVPASGVVQGGAEGQPIVVQGGGGGAASGGTIIIGGGGGTGVSAGDIAGAMPTGNISPEALAQGESLSATAANLAAAGQAAAQAQLALSQLQGGSAINPAQIKATDPAEIEEAVKNYTEELKELTEVLGRVKAQAARMSTDSEEMENLNRTLTGIATVYELQLRNISKQVSTIEQIDEQTRRMAKQIEELNDVYARMIQALTINMKPVVQQSGDSQKA
ncbi:MAG: gliding motility protein GldL [Prevotellaceae bacterium]|nr:gliding motility protein GldL [Prevotellaceae bacterium]